jgi:hypothetical protein
VLHATFTHATRGYFALKQPVFGADILDNALRQASRFALRVVERCVAGDAVAAGFAQVGLEKTADKKLATAMMPSALVARPFGGPQSLIGAPPSAITSIVA